MNDLVQCAEESAAEFFATGSITSLAQAHETLEELRSLYRKRPNDFSPEAVAQLRLLSGRLTAKVRQTKDSLAADLVSAKRQLRHIENVVKAVQGILQPFLDIPEGTSVALADGQLIVKRSKHLFFRSNSKQMRAELRTELKSLGLWEKCASESLSLVRKALRDDKNVDTTAVLDRFLVERDSFTFQARAERKVSGRTSPGNLTSAETFDGGMSFVPEMTTDNDLPDDLGFEDIDHDEDADTEDEQDDEQKTKRSNWRMLKGNSYDKKDENRLVTEELDEYSDGLARAHSDGWFYPEVDINEVYGEEDDDDDDDDGDW